MCKLKARSVQGNAGCGPGKRPCRGGTGLPQGKKCASVLSSLHLKNKETSADIWISEDGLGEVGLRIDRTPRVAVRSELNAESHLKVI